MNNKLNEEADGTTDELVDGTKNKSIRLCKM